jgi:hypothetical protein
VTPEERDRRDREDARMGAVMAAACLVFLVFATWLNVGAVMAATVALGAVLGAVTIHLNDRA